MDQIAQNRDQAQPLAKTAARLSIVEYENPYILDLELVGANANIDDVFDFIINNRQNFFRSEFDNECMGCCGKPVDKRYRSKCSGCDKDPTVIAIN